MRHNNRPQYVSARQGANVSFDISLAQTRHSALVKSFGRRQASESRRGTNPRCAGRGLWGFDVLAVPGWAGVKCAGLDRVRIARAFPGDHGRYSKAIDWPFRRSRQRSAALTTRVGPSARGLSIAEATCATAWRGNERAPGHDGAPVAAGAAWRRARLHPAFEGLDDAHAPAAARTGRELIRRLLGLDGFWRRPIRPAVRGRGRCWPCVSRWRTIRNAGCGGSRAAGHAAGSGA